MGQCRAAADTTSGESDAELAPTPCYALQGFALDVLKEPTIASGRAYTIPIW